MSAGRKLPFTKKDMTWWTLTGCVFNKEWANSHISRCFSEGRDNNISNLSHNSTSKLKHWVTQSLDFEKLKCSPWQTNNGYKKERSCPLSHALTMNQNPDLVQITKEQISLVSAVKSLGLCPAQMVKLCTDKVYFAKQNMAQMARPSTIKVYFAKQTLKIAMLLNNMNMQICVNEIKRKSVITLLNKVQYLSGSRHLKNKYIHVVI